MIKKTIVFRLILAAALATALPLFPAQAAQPAGDQLDPKVHAFLLNHQVNRQLGQQLDAIFCDEPKTQIQLLSLINRDELLSHLETVEKELNAQGFKFDFARHENIFTHTKFPEYIFKMPKKNYPAMSPKNRHYHKNLLQHNAGRIKYGLDLQETIRTKPEVSRILQESNLPPKITFAHKQAYFPKRTIASFCKVMVIAQKLDLKPIKDFDLTQFKGAQRLSNFLGYDDFNCANVVLRGAPYHDLVFCDTEPQEIKLTYRPVEKIETVIDPDLPADNLLLNVDPNFFHRDARKQKEPIADTSSLTPELKSHVVEDYYYYER